MTRRTHGARLAENVIYEALPRYSSADGEDYFGWANMKPKTPLILAKRFLVEFQKFAEQGKHPDPAYARWFAAMLSGFIAAACSRTKPCARVCREAGWERV